MEIDGDGGDESGCWRKEVDTKLKRLHSLLFSTDRAMEKSDFTSAHILGVRLLGFLESQIRTPVDAAYISPIHAEVSSKVAFALRSLAPDSNRRAFEQAKREEGKIFVKGGGFDVEKVKKSQFFRQLVGKTEVKNAADKKDHSTGSMASSSDHIISEQSNFSNMNFFGDIGTHSDERAIVVENRDVAGQDCLRNTTVGNNYLKKNCSSTTFVGKDEERCHLISGKTKRRNTGFTSPVCENVKASIDNEDSKREPLGKGFVTAREKLERDAKQKHWSMDPQVSNISPNGNSYANIKGYGARSGGLFRRGARGSFVPPIRSNTGNSGNMMNSRNSGKGDDSLEDSTRRWLEMLCGKDGELPEKLRNLEPRLIEHICNEIMDKDPNVRWDDIAGLEHAKKCVTEMVIWPLLRPDIFKGCRSPGRGLLLFGPPGTGKTMIGKAIAGESNATFFYISASSLTSKWRLSFTFPVDPRCNTIICFHAQEDSSNFIVIIARYTKYLAVAIGEGEKLVRALFAVACCRQPAVIFVDEIDSLLSQRKSDGEHESSRRMKTQFLIEMEGFDSGNEQILLIGATNRPQELDEAARRRLTKRLYIPLPSLEARAWIVRNLLVKDGLFKLSEEDIVSICKLTEGYSGSDMKNLVKDASMGPLREAMKQGIEITKLRKEDMRQVKFQDFEDALQEVRPSVSPNELDTYEDWNKQFGSLTM